MWVCKWVSQVRVRWSEIPVLRWHSSRWQNNRRKPRKGGFLGRIRKQKKGFRGKSRLREVLGNKMYLQYCDPGWHVMDEVGIMMTEGYRSGLLGFIPASFTVCEGTFASCHKRLRPQFYGVHTQKGMSNHSCCLDGTATGREAYLFFFRPPFTLKVLQHGWQV